MRETFVWHSLHDRNTKIMIRKRWRMEMIKYVRILILILMIVIVNNV